MGWKRSAPVSSRAALPARENIPRRKGRARSRTHRRAFPGGVRTRSSAPSFPRPGSSRRAATRGSAPCMICGKGRNFHSWPSDSPASRCAGSGTRNDSITRVGLKLMSRLRSVRSSSFDFHRASLLSGVTGGRSRRAERRRAGLPPALIGKGRISSIPAQFTSSAKRKSSSCLRCSGPPRRLRCFPRHACRSLVEAIQAYLVVLKWAEF